jgi:hypothetical protein
MQQRALWAAMLSAGLLMACGGGGGDEQTASSTAQVSLSGVAAKGLMAGAVVTVHAVAADGTVGDPIVTTPAEVITDAEGQYTLSFAGTKDQPYVVKVTARAGTTHLDEVAGAAVALPVGFTMRSVVVPAATGAVTTSAGVTPFSEMAVAAAERTSGGITSGNVQQAVSTVKQLVGFDPTTALPSLTGTPEQQKLAIMLTAVAKLADGGALGCDAGTSGEKTQCVVEALAGSASATSLKLNRTEGETTLDVSAALGTALSEVLADDTLNGDVDATLLASVTDGLACSGDDCVAAPVEGSTSVAGAIAAAKTLFANLKSDWSSIFSRGGASSIATGAANAELWKFQQAMTGVQVPAEVMVKDSSALLMGIDLYNDYHAGRETSVKRGRAPGATANDGSAPDFNAVGCALYQDSNTSVPATSTDNASFIGCRGTYYVQQSVVGDTKTTTEWRHGFTITPGMDGSYTYTTRARRRVETCVGSSPCTITTNEALQTSGYSGTVSTTTTNGHVTAFTIEGKLPGAFESGGTTVINDHHDVSLTGTRTIDAQNMSSTTFSGSLVAYSSADVVEGTLAVTQGSTSETPVWRDASDNEVEPNSPTAVSPFGGTLSSAALTLKWTTGAAEFEGSLSLADSQWDASGTEILPTSVTLAGALRNLSAEAAQEFLSGSLTATLAGFETYDATQPDSVSNFNTVSLTFLGKVSAPSRPVLDLTLGVSQKSYEDEPSAMSMQYRSLVAGSPKHVIAVAGTRGTDGMMNFTLTEATSNLSLAWADGAVSGDLKWGTTKIGEVGKEAKGVTFSNGEFMSLDIGL